METFDLELSLPPKKKLKIGGTVYEITEPTVGMVAKLGAVQESASDQDKLAYAIEFMASLGLPKDVSENLTLDSFSKLVEFVVGAKKN